MGWLGAKGFSTGAQRLWYHAGSNHFHRPAKRKGSPLDHGRSPGLRRTRGGRGRSPGNGVYRLPAAPAGGRTKQGNRFHIAAPSAQPESDRGGGPVEDHAFTQRTRGRHARDRFSALERRAGANTQRATGHVADGMAGRPFSPGYPTGGQGAAGDAQDGDDSNGGTGCDTGASHRSTVQHSDASHRIGRASR